MLAIRRETCIIDEQGIPPCSYGLVAQLGERSVRIREVEGSNPFRSTKQVLDEHLFLQRRLRREVFALIQNRKSAVLEILPRRRFLQYIILFGFISLCNY